MSKTAMIWTHLQNEGPGTFLDILTEEGFETEILLMPCVDVDGIDVLAPDLLIVMGGPISTYDSNNYPFLKTEMRFLRQRIEAGKATMGICLGAQLLASSLGGDVYKGETGPEIGWHQITLSPDALGHPVRHICQPHSNMFHFHGDTFSLPDGAHLIASSAKYMNQVFEIGTYALGLQCHPEIKGHALEEWFVAFHSDLIGANPVMPIDKIRGDTAQYAPVLEAQNKKFFIEWLTRAGL